MSLKPSINSSKPHSTVRESSIELLRILTICGVIILHYNGFVGHALELAKPGSLNYWLLNVLQALFIGSVNIFVLISGYFSCNSQRRDPVKALQLLVQVIVFQVGFYILRTLTGTPFSLKGLVLAIIPANYFVILYIVVYLLGPYINLLLKKLTDTQLTRFVLLAFILFSVLPTATDLLEAVLHTSLVGINPVGAYGDGWGYTATNFILMYVIGAYLRLHGIPKLKVWHLAGIILLCIGCITVFSQHFPTISQSYCNPIVIVLAASIFLLFTKFSFRSAVVNHLSKASFTVFLFHSYPLSKFHVERFVTANPLLLLGHLLLVCICIYLMSWIVYLIYDFVTRPVFKWLSKAFPPKEI